MVEGQRLTQVEQRHPARLAESAVGPDGKKRDFYVRQLWDEKGSALVDDDVAGAMAVYARSAAGSWPAPTPAPATGSRSAPTSAAATASTGRSARFRRAYADQNERDYAALQAAVEDGRLAVEREAD